jgi:hypothetical protein
MPTRSPPTSHHHLHLNSQASRPLSALQNVSSAFGAFLDPVADKLMVATVLILLCTAPLPAGMLAGNGWILPVATCGVWGEFSAVLDNWQANVI